MSKKLMLVGLAILATMIVVIVGSGGSSNHTSEWSKAQTASLENKISSTAPSLSSAGRACYTKGVKADFAPSVLGDQNPSSSDKDKVKKILAGCGYSAPSTSTSPNSNGGETYGPACKQQLTS